jgi:hypothetical protein
MTSVVEAVHELATDVRAFCALVIVLVLHPEFSDTKLWRETGDSVVGNR